MRFLVLRFLVFLQKLTLFMIFAFCVGGFAATAYRGFQESVTWGVGGIILGFILAAVLFKIGKLFSGFLFGAIYTVIMPKELNSLIRSSRTENYTYEMFMWDVESILYDEQGIELIHDFTKGMSKPEDFILSHVVYVNSLFYLNFKNIQDQVRGVYARDHLFDLIDLFVVHSSNIGYGLRNDIEIRRFEQTLGRTIDAMSKDDPPDIEDIVCHYLNTPMEKAIYKRSVDHRILMNMKSLTKLLKAEERNMKVRQKKIT